MENKPEIAKKAMEMKLEQRVVDDVTYCIDTLASHLGVEVKERPKIVASDIETSYHRPETNEIGIHASHKGDGITYFEEAAHYLRDQMYSEKEDGASTAMDEFFGRLGESIGRKIVDKEHARLFKGKKERKSSDPKLIAKKTKKLIEIANTFEAVSKKLDEITVRYDKIYVPCSKHLNRIVRAYESYNKTNNLEKLNERFCSIGTDLRADIARVQESKRFSSERVKTTIEIYIANLKLFRDNMGRIKEYNQQHPGNQGIELGKMNRELKHCLDRAREILKEQKIRNKKYGEFDSARMEIELPLLIETNSEIIHSLGYIAAEEYVKQNPNFLREAPELFRQSDEEIMERFITDEVMEKYFSIARKVAAKKGVVFDRAA